LDLRVRDRRLIIARDPDDPKPDLPHLRHFLEWIEASLSAPKCQGTA
jgi:hypothetical protein